LRIHEKCDPHPQLTAERHIVHREEESPDILPEEAVPQEKLTAQKHSVRP
jgi:hypothetical protein